MIDSEQQSPGIKDKPPLLSVPMQESPQNSADVYLLTICLSVLAIDRLLHAISLCLAIAPVVAMTIASSVAIAPV